MSAAEHTPGPWTVCEHSWSDASVYDANENHVCSLCIEDDCTEETQEEWEKIMADRARLIAAAPDMLAALELAVHVRGTSDDTVEVRNAMDAAIRKAKGEA